MLLNPVPFLMCLNNNYQSSWKLVIVSDVSHDIYEGIA